MPVYCNGDVEAIAAVICTVQALDKKDRFTRALVEVLLAWPAAQAELYEAEFKQQAKYLALDPKHADSIAKAAQDTWTKATSDLNRVRALTA